MTIWRPPPEIRVKVLGLAWRGSQLLLAEVEDDAGRVKGYRPLGGCVEFGETREAALRREFAEELGCGVTVIGPWHAFENLYRHEGAIGHEYLFAAAIRLDDEWLYALDRIAFREADLTGCRAGWFDPRALPEGSELYPGGLRTLIESGALGS
jgi:ADP-ribose pyrophosphatase YjhB (NUDIX family)